MQRIRPCLCIRFDLRVLWAFIAHSSGFRKRSTLTPISTAPIIAIALGPEQGVRLCVPAPHAAEMYDRPRRARADHHRRKGDAEPSLDSQPSVAERFARGDA